MRQTWRRFRPKDLGSVDDLLQTGVGGDMNFEKPEIPNYRI